MTKHLPWKSITFDIDYFFNDREVLNFRDGEIATHPCLDLGLQRLDIVRNIIDGVPNPFVLGIEGYKYYEKQFYELVKEARNR